MVNEVQVRSQVVVFTGTKRRQTNRGHEPSQLQQHHPDAVGVLPLGQCSHRMHVNLEEEEEEEEEETPAHCPISHTFLAFLQLLQEPEIARNFNG
ncbi:hypothetical protein INR49_003538, partial [Caranx melampygus]